MKTKKQVLAMFQRMQRQLLGDGFVELDAYMDGNFWTIKLNKVTFTENSEIKTRDWVEWEHFRYQREEVEQENEAKVAEFKERFGLV